jgi:hypothetical protein
MEARLRNPLLNFFRPHRTGALAGPRSITKPVIRRHDDLFPMEYFVEGD